MIAWLRELNPEHYLIQPPAEIGGSHQGVIVIEAHTLELIDEYAFSTPTGPSAGRVYRRNHMDPDGHPDMPYVFVVIDDPDGEGQLHIPHRALVLT